MQFLKDFFEGGDEGIIKRCNVIVELAIKANREILNTLNTKDISKIRDIEKNSDNVVFNISNLVTSGGIAPNLIDDLLQLIQKEDSIVDSIYNLARELARYSTKNKKATKKLMDTTVSMNRLADSAISMLHKMQESDNIIEIKKLRGEIELLEEKGDELKDALFDFAYKSPIDFKTFYHTFEIAHLLDDILDNCEDASDMYLTIISSLIA
ncbi:MAG: DUF47 domain-containing protein [Candidatus Micrarchaeia archaeon]